MSSLEIIGEKLFVALAGGNQTWAQCVNLTRKCAILAHCPGGGRGITLRFALAPSLLKPFQTMNQRRQSEQAVNSFAPVPSWERRRSRVDSALTFRLKPAGIRWHHSIGTRTFHNSKFFPP